jgi:hypothetical protein
MNLTLAGIAMIGGAFAASVPTRTPWLGSRYYARLRGRGQRRPRGQSRLGGWDDRAPMTKKERAKVAKKCGSRCFAGPNRSYPRACAVRTAWAPAPRSVELGSTRSRRSHSRRRRPARRPGARGCAARQRSRY